MESTNIISPLNQALYKMLVRLIINTVDHVGNRIWNLSNNIFMLGYSSNNISLPNDNQYILIKRGAIKSLMHQQYPIKDYTNQTVKRTGEFTVVVTLEVVSTTQKSLGLSLEEQWSELFYQEVIAKWLNPFNLLNTPNRFNSINPIYLEIDNGCYIIKNIFEFTLMYKTESVDNYLKYDTIDENLHQINRDT